MVAGVAALKERPAARSWSPAAPAGTHAARAGLVDEVSLLLHPVVVGSGERLFEEGASVPLKLAGCDRLGTGVVHLAYQPA